MGTTTHSTDVAPVREERVPGSRGRRAWRAMRGGWQLYVLLLLPVVYLIVFKYWPMYGAQIAFRNFNPIDGISGSPWVGLENFQRFIAAYDFWSIIKNTLILSGYQLAAGFPVPIILAIGLNYLIRTRLRRVIQMVTFAPHFISTVVLVGIVFLVLDPRTGMLNQFLRLFGLDSIDMMSDPSYFSHVYVWSGIWQNAGFGTVVYLAALANVDPTLHEAAIVDGATKFRRVLHIDLPAIAPIVIILLILDLGHILDVGFQKILLLQNPINMPVSEVIDTYVYHVGLASAFPQYSYAAAIGLFKSVIALILIAVANQIARRLSDASLW